ncbi:MAG TPA: PolC-type DNA polymerase III, partial [Anaerovoracaceae bacterium]|nr:PolC-type DNA polymerase III [Anaerovoracaceae bacterium]
MRLPIEENNQPSFNGGKRYSRAKESPAVGNCVLGKKIDSSSTPLSSLNSGMNNVVVEGCIFKKSARAIKDDRQIVDLMISDNSESSCIKLIVSSKKWEEINIFLKEGDWIKARGRVEYDSFEGADVIRAKDIEKTHVMVKTDTAPKKRVELHAHTKLSTMDGLADVEDLITAAANFSHNAVAITDHGVVQAFPDAAKFVENKKLDIKIIYGLEGYLVDDEKIKDDEFDYKSAKSYHIVILAKNQKGLQNLYRLVSTSHLKHFYRRPRILKSSLRSFKDGLIIGSACQAGEVYQGVLNKLPHHELEEMLTLYDYLEIQPLINNQFLVDTGRVSNIESLKELNREIIKLGEKYDKLVVATCDSHYIEENDALYRKIIMSGQGYKDADSGEGLYFRTTDEMLNEFSYLGDDMATKVVVENTNKIADSIERIAPVPAESYRPKIHNADERLRSSCLSEAERIYGNPLPKAVSERLERELDSIIGNGYAVLYVSSEILVNRSLSAGYIVGSRGSVGSSFAATMAGITEVNPLPPHYVCSGCKNSEFIYDSEYDCGVDLPDKYCPKCGKEYRKDGFNIPFETFMGFEGNKEPDIDLNFAGEYQAVAHKHVEDIFGEENVFRAGTISRVASRTAYGFVRKYYEEKQNKISKWEIERLTMKCTGVRRTTGQHPGGIVILPRGHEIYEFCPIQRPANDVKSDVITTHYDYHSIDKNLLKLDILGHDVPSMLRMLKDLTGVDPLTIPLKDKKVDGIFNGVRDLDIKSEDYSLTHGTYGIPEFGTQFVRQMLDDIKPSYFSDLIRISGLSHGTDVWINNAQNVIKGGHAAFQEIICTRDDIMNGLIAKGLPAKTAFNIMEKVRKGNGVTEEEIEIMKKNGVPSWYIESCEKIGYMFPKAHAVAYVIMSYRIAYYKVYHPLAFYATFFTTKVADFNAEIILGGESRISN